MDLRLALGLVRPVLAALLGHSSHCADRADQLLIDRHLTLRVGPIGHQLVDEGLDVAVVVQPHAELHGSCLPYSTGDEEGLEVDRVLVGRRVQVLGGEGPASRRAPGVRGGIPLDRGLREVLVVLAEEADDECVDVRALSPLAPGLERVLEAEHLAAVGEGVRDRLGVGSLVREVARGDDALDEHLATVERVALEQLQQGVLHLGLALVQLVHEQDDLLLDLPLDGEHLGRCVVDALVVVDEGESDEVGRLEDGQVEVVDRELLGLGRLDGHLGLADAGLTEAQEIAARADVVPEGGHVDILRDARNVRQHVGSAPGIAAAGPSGRSSHSRYAAHGPLSSSSFN